MDFDRVQSLLLMILYRRRYVAQREQARMQHFGQPGKYPYAAGLFTQTLIEVA